MQVGFTAVFKTQAHLDRHRHVRGGRHFAHDIRRAPGIAHQRAPLAIAHDLGHRTAHVDIQQRIAAILCQLIRGARHDIRLMAEDLKRNGPCLARIDAQQFAHGPVVPRCEQIALGADHLADGHRTAHLMADHAKGHIRHAGHGREHRPAGEKIEICRHAVTLFPPAVTSPGSARSAPGSRSSTGPPCARASRGSATSSRPAARGAPRPPRPAPPPAWTS